MVIALGITISMSGEKRFLGFVETDTENERVLTPLLRLDIEPRLRKVMSYRDLPKLRAALKCELKNRDDDGEEARRVSNQEP